MQNIKSVEKAVDILSCFTIETPSLSVSEICTMTGITQSTVSRILATLDKKRCLERDPESGKYRLGIRFHQWKGALAQEADITDLARPIMENLRDDCGEEVTLYVPGDGNRICAEAVKSRYGVAKITQVGKVLPLHCGASGKVILAHLPEKTRKRIVHSGTLEKYTPKTLTDPAKLEADLARIRTEGYAVSIGEREEGTYSVVAPVFDNSGSIAASLCISGPIFRFPEEERGRLVEAVRCAARKISMKLGSARGNEQAHDS
ncbi:MAG TPA: IclR family transcriptional regulator [Deltaproteobacteria bacterium]|jgi:DNA-binding IclR family transcriptional regulator|nr:IclR family transcriptional regulator [Deltaproteobacteria bacterium]HOI05770.1 IclR family transcriptional regulator [Deltaproteobacteria bacterium]